MADLPCGTVTFLFTGIEGSTKLLNEFRERYAEALAGHRRRLREAFTRQGGVEVDTQGDACLYAIRPRPETQSAPAADAQRALAYGEARTRMGIHDGESILTEEGCVGLALHRGARMAAAGHGGQVLVSQATRELLPEALNGLTFRNLGEHRLKDLSQPQSLYQPVGEGL